MNNKEIFFIVAALAAATVITRFLPFVLFPKGKKVPSFVVYLGKILPFAAIGLLVVSCFSGVSFLSYPYGLPEIICVAAAALIHWKKKNTLLSISVSTVMYMILIRFVF